MQEKCLLALYKGIPNSEWVLFEHSSHLPHVEEEEKYMQTVGAFLARVESSLARGLGESLAIIG
jgi:pimeloyl-ACP methyl ester carboxylesterase